MFCEGKAHTHSFLFTLWLSFQDLVSTFYTNAFLKSSARLVDAFVFSVVIMLLINYLKKRNAVEVLDFFPHVLEMVAFMRCFSSKKKKNVRFLQMRT